MLDLSNGYFHLPIREQDRKYFGFTFDHTYYVFNSLCFGYSPAPDFFQFFSQEIVRILQEQNVGCEVELDDFLIHANSYEKCKKDVELAINLSSYFRFKINFAKSCFIPSQKIDILGYTLDAKNCRFVQEKLVKCRLIIKALSLLRSIKVKLLQRIIGFLNFACQFLSLGPIFGPSTFLPIFQLLVGFVPIQALLFISWRYFSKAHYFMLGLLGLPDIPCPVLLMLLILG